MTNYNLPGPPLQPAISVLCATYRRPRLVANSYACFLAQEFPGSTAELLILDDGGDLEAADHERVRIFAEPRRFPSTASKYNWLAARARGDLLVVWDDDDVYLPWHLADLTRAMEFGDWSKPAWVYQGSLLTRTSATGRFHGTIGLRRSLLERAGGWPETPRADWSLGFLRQLASFGEPIDSIGSLGRSSYVYRRPPGAQVHATRAMTSPSDQHWYQRYGELLDAAKPKGTAVRLAPQFDLDTIAIYRRAGVVPQRTPFSSNATSAVSTP